MRKTWIVATILLMGVTLESSAENKSQKRGHRSSLNSSESSQDIRRILAHLKSSQDKIIVYRLWIDSLKLWVDDLDQDRLAGTLTNARYDASLAEISREIQMISQEAKRLGFDELADIWEGLAFQYTRTMGNLIDK